jgi:hypothetical protein
VVQTIEAVLDESGAVRLLERIDVGKPRRALITILEEPPLLASETALLSEDALAEDWLRPEEEASWSHLQSAR